MKKVLGTYSIIIALATLLVACPAVAPVTIPSNQIATGNHHSLWIVDGAVYGAGEDRFGQLGQGQEGAKENPQALKVSGLADITQVFAASGGNHNLALQADGTAYGWGWNNLGQVGTGEKGEHVYTPVKLGVPKLEAAALGTAFTLALTREGDVYVWGRNNLGQLGMGDFEERLTPTAMTLKDIVAVANGINHGVALTKDGEVYTWGTNSRGQIGNGERATGSKGAVTSPYKVTLAGKAVAIGAGNMNTFAILENGDLYAWGDNFKGLLGDGTTEHRTSPTLITAVRKVKQVDSGARHTMVLLQDGKVMVWGDGKVGQLGNGASGNDVASSTPIAVTLEETATEIMIGTNHNLVRLASGKVVGFGSNGFGRLAQPLETEVVSTPTVVKQ